MKAPAAQRAQQTRPHMKERKSWRNFLPRRAPAPLPIHFYCREPLARVSRETVPVDSARADWFPEIQQVKADPVDKDQAADAAAREEDRAASAGPPAGGAGVGGARAGGVGGGGGGGG